MQKIIVSRQKLRITGICPKCKQYIFVNADKLFQDKKFTCYKCGKKSNLDEVTWVVDVWRYINFFLKCFMQHNEKNELENEVEVICPNVDNKVSKNDFDRLLKFIENNKIGWEIKDIKEKPIKLEVCPDCVVCFKCGKVSKPKDSEGHFVCGECGHWEIKHLEAKDNKCQNCGNAKLKVIVKKTMSAIVSIERIRRFMYSKKDLVLEDG